jgi:DNA-3-methyladenine glycosylase I
MALEPGADGKKRCFGNAPGKEFYGAYHDEEWGIPVHDDRQLFEGLILEGAQAGLSWETVLRKREGYRAAFHGFDIARVAAMSDTELEALRENPAIIRNRLKIYSARKNAIAFIAMQQEFGSFDTWLWAHVDGQPIINRPASFAEVPASTELSDTISKALKKRGMNFVGSTIIYAYLQAVGVVNDHVQGCWRHPN